MFESQIVTDIGNVDLCAFKKLLDPVTSHLWIILEFELLNRPPISHEHFPFGYDFIDKRFTI